jgi:Ca-activated chloride channel family protein
MDLLYAARLAPLPKSDLSSRLFQLRHEWFQWPLGLAILLLMIELLAPDRVRVARQPEGAQRKGLQAPTAALGFFLALVLPVPVAGSAASARRHYEAGRFEAARRDYQRLLEAAPDDARLQYNTGTAAHRAQRFAEATNALQSALLSSDPQLLQRAYYNLGNSFYRLGEKTEDLNARLQHWEQALEHYNSALKLSQRDADTRFNRDLVAKKLEELKKQMPPPQSKQDQQSKEDKGDQQKQKDQDQQKSSAEKEQKKEPESSEEKKQQPDQGKEDSSQQQPQEQQQQEQGDKEQSHKQDKKQDESQPTGAEEKQPQSSPEQGRPPDQTDASQAAATALGQMTPEQARRLLDTVKAEERPMIFRPAKESRAGARSYRNW